MNCHAVVPHLSAPALVESRIAGGPSTTGLCSTSQPAGDRSSFFQPPAVSRKQRVKQPKAVPYVGDHDTNQSPSISGRTETQRYRSQTEPNVLGARKTKQHRARNGARRATAVDVATEEPTEEDRTPQRRRYNLMDDVGPNPLVLEAQGKVCTGPTQTRPLDEEQCRAVLDAIIRSAKGELPLEERVSLAQMGAFFGAMTLRAETFPPPTQWSEGEKRAMAEKWPELQKVLPPEVQFLADPEGTLLEGLSPVGPGYTGHSGRAEERLVGDLREILSGEHLGYEELCGLLREILPLDHGHAGFEGSGREGFGEEGSVSDALVAAFLICQRMNKETARELKAYNLALDDDVGQPPVADVRSLTHYGEPYDGNTRFMRSTLFVMAVRASYGEAGLLHGIDYMPPKMGVTEERMLRHLGAATTLRAPAAVTLLEDERVAFAYLSQREVQPSAYSLNDMRLHIKKRPPFATTEKVQRFVQATGREAMVAGYYHEGYEEPLLMLIRRRGVDAGMVVKGEEGAVSLTTKSRSPDSGGGPGERKLQAVNHVSGFRPVDDVPGELLHREPFTLDVEAERFGFKSTATPRTDRSAAKNVELGMAALRGEKGPAYDRIVFNAAMQDHLLGCNGASDPMVAIERAKDAIDSGAALQRLENYVRLSHKLL